MTDAALELQILRAVDSLSPYRTAGGLTSDQVHDAVKEPSFSRVYVRCLEMQERGMIIFVPAGCVWKISSSGKLRLSEQVSA